MKQEIHITLCFDLATGKVSLNEIVYKLKQLRDPLMVKILEQILTGYDDLICERLSGTYCSTERKGLGDMAKRITLKTGFAEAARSASEVIETIPGSFPRFSGR